MPLLSGLGEFLGEENSAKSGFLAKAQRRKGFLQIENRQPTTNNQKKTTNVSECGSSII